MALSKATLKRIHAMEANGQVKELPKPVQTQIPQKAYLTSAQVQKQVERDNSYLHGHFGQYTAADLINGPHPRRFVLEYDHSRETTFNIEHEQKKFKTMACWCTRYPNGHIMLDNGIFFRTEEDFHAHFTAWGVYRMTMIGDPVIE